MQSDWYSLNTQCLSAALAEIKQLCEAALAKKPLPSFSPSQNQPQFESAALTRVCRIFQLNEFERKLLLLCAAVQLDGEFGKLCEKLQNDTNTTLPTFDLALTLFNEGVWLPFSPQSSLRHWRLIEISDAQQPHLTPLRINETVLHYITGYASSEPALASLTIPNDFHPDLSASQLQLAQKVTKLIQQPINDALPPFIQLRGNDKQASIGVVQAAANNAKIPLKRIDASLLPHSNNELHTLFIQLEREAILYQCLYCFECESDHSQQTAIQHALHYLFKRLSAFCILVGPMNIHLGARDHIKLDVHLPTYPEQQLIWQQQLPHIFNDNPSTTPELKDGLTAILDQFNLSLDAIHSIARQWSIEYGEVTPLARKQILSLCRKQCRADIHGLAKVIEPVDLKWDNIVLPPEQLTTLRSIIEQVRHRNKVYRQWGFAEGAAYGLGIGALFSGASGTGKTLAARVIASELKLDIYQIDLSSIVSKYIGETEKNLEKIFTAAESSGAILLFDEADALFGKRSEVKDSRDRYANMEVSYLLQRIENFSGLAILTSNFRKALDPAFLRRLRFIVQFPFPQPTERAAIWQNVFPAQLPTYKLDIEKLARLEIPGGLIRSIAINAAFHAATDDALNMKHIRKAAMEEYKKTEKTLIAELVADW